MKPPLEPILTKDKELRFEDDLSFNDLFPEEQCSELGDDLYEHYGNGISYHSDLFATLDEYPSFASKHLIRFELKRFWPPRNGHPREVRRLFTEGQRYFVHALVSSNLKQLKRYLKSDLVDLTLPVFCEPENLYLSYLTFYLLTKNPKVEIVKLLLQAGQKQDPNFVNMHAGDGFTALKAASKHSNPEIFDLVNTASTVVDSLCTVRNEF